MYYPSFEEFLKLLKAGNVIPVYKEINADLDTPVSCFLRMRKNEYAFLLESVEGQENVARYSFLGSNPSIVFKSKGGCVEKLYPNKNKRKQWVTSSTPLDDLKAIMQDFKPVSVKGLPRFYGGMVGFIGYDMVRFFEEIPDKNSDDLNLPDCLFMLTDTLLVFDHVNHTIKIVSNCIFPGKQKLTLAQKAKIYKNALASIDSIEKDLLAPLRYRRDDLPKRPVPAKAIRSNCTKAYFSRMVRIAKSHIKKGDIIQVVPSQRFEVKVSQDHFSIYRTLRSLNPSPYMFFLKLADITLVGASPEMLIRCEDGLVETRPIAGTRPRGLTAQEDRALEKELLADEKEKAEHLMLVDLGRNDLGRVCRKGTVKVHEFMRVERYSHVMHLVSDVRGTLDNTRFDIYDVIKASFPAGTVSGSPKIRAMEIIDQLENTRRGCYAGCVGYFSFSHNMDTCITIRTIVLKKNTAYIQAGAGIVADSIPAKEYIETVNKAKALIEAITR